LQGWPAWPAWPENIGGDLVLGGDWRIDAGDQANGRVSLARERGDLIVSAAPDAAAALGLQQLSLLAEASDSRLHISLAANGTALGRLRAQADSRFSRRDGVWGIAADTPFQASADLALQSLAWATPLLDKTGATRFDGRLAARLQGSGSLAAPRLAGSLSGEGFSLALPEQGLDLRDGRFQAELGQDTLVLKSLSLRGGDGSLTGQGRLGLRDGQPDLQLALKADKLRIVSRPDRLLVLSGDGSVALLARKLQLRARLKADRGLVELARDDAPTLSEDVVVLGREGQAAARGIPYAVDLDLDLDLGERFFLKGRGIDAQLGGAVKLTGRQGLPLRGTGGIRVVKGTYAAYGQRLDIERGQLNFQGPLDNPGLNIVALRKNQAVAAGVAITGSAQAPVVKLVSEPTLPDSDKLSWLVLGHGMADTGSREFDALQLAAGALLGAGESVTLQQRIAHAAGLEEVSLKGAGTLESSVLTLGKRLSSRAYLSYEQGLLGTEALVKINYTLSRRLSLRTQAGTDPAVDLFYTFSFD
ncbi:MAG: translocation/assembly module TamB domain-containing protein, partial [Hydrogenophilaceae bacterium]